MQKLGMKPVPGVTRVTIKKSKNVRLGRDFPAYLAVSGEHLQPSCLCGG